MEKELVKSLQQSSHLSSGNISYIEALYDAYLSDPHNVAEHWRTYFDDLSAPHGSGVADTALSDVRAQFSQLAKGYDITAPGVVISPERLASELAVHEKQVQIEKLINAYRSYGHHHAKLDPLSIEERKEFPLLTLEHYGLSNADLENYVTASSFVNLPKTSLGALYKALNKTYCNAIGIEYMHITNAEQIHWLQQRLEPVQSHPVFSTKEKRHILKLITWGEGLERYLGAKFVGQTRFSLEGGVSLIPMLDELVKRAARRNVKELIIGMGHRGRLNVLVNIMGKSLETLFEEFAGKSVHTKYSGDVKYHSGYSSNVRIDDHIIHLALAFNPSHLEIIDPVVEGSVRARQERHGDHDHHQVVPVLIHGDAAFAGQGVVMETFSFSQARGFSTGGTVHIVVNNQIGFTTSNPLDARSTLYCTDVAKMVQAPVIHVNGDNPEAVVFAIQVAFDFRMQFKKDVVVDLVCYRRYGHNEADEPSATQPLMYQKIKNRKRLRLLYAEQLLEQGVVTQEEIDAESKRYRDLLDQRGTLIETIPKEHSGLVLANWRPYKDQSWENVVETKITTTTLQRLGQKLIAFPEGFTLQAQVAKEYENRKKMLSGDIPANWGFAEALAYASLLEAGYLIRISGQDSGRGTFAHRHAVLHDQKDGRVYTPLQHLSENQGQFSIIDSILSEEGVLGFEYGYATTDPEALVIWEAQYGDFANGAQVVIDQFITSGEQKWGRLCGLVLYLPHGYEGAGPEHSSARVERFMQACAEHNIQVVIPSTPAQMFHMIRRQILRPYRKPLIVMTPKSLLRHKLSTSPLEAFTDGEFYPVIPEIDNLKLSEVKQIILCSGKVYFDLLQQRRKNDQKDVAIIRIGQLYPFPTETLTSYLAKHKKAKQVIWCQEEPKNQGAWYSSQHHFMECLAKDQTLSYVGRPSSASPATGYTSIHLEQQAALVKEALTVTNRSTDINR